MQIVATKNCIFPLVRRAKFGFPKFIGWTFIKLFLLFCLTLCIYIYVKCIFQGQPQESCRAVRQGDPAVENRAGTLAHIFSPRRCQGSADRSRQTENTRFDRYLNHSHMDFLAFLNYSWSRDSFLVLRHRCSIPIVK